MPEDNITEGVVYAPDPAVLYVLWVEQETWDQRDGNYWAKLEPAYPNTDAGMAMAVGRADALAAEGQRVRVFRKRRGIYG